MTLGEVCYIWERGLINNQRCGCGSSFRDCPFWKDVINKFESTYPDHDPKGIVELASQVSRSRHVPAHLLGWNIGGFKQRVASYVRYVQFVYESAREQSDATVLIDTSKHAHGHLLVALANIDLYVVHIVRDSRATAFSWSRRKVYESRSGGDILFPSFGPLTAARHWITDNLSAEILRYRSPNYLLVRYEDFVEDPNREIGRIFEFVGEPISTDPVSETMTITLEPRHSVAGNPVRFQSGKVSIEADDVWKTEMRSIDWWLVGLMTWPLLIRYGYL